MTRSIDLLDPSTEAVIETVPLISVEETEYGLSGSIWTENVGRALRVSRAVQA
ncbi:MAG: hypothetical protein QOF38_4454, partial [Pseudonocardiales bacterium]|nr:hypothetical protein [Pseudonocardiales bacterium]